MQLHVYISLAWQQQRMAWKGQSEHKEILKNNCLVALRLRSSFGLRKPPSALRKATTIEKKLQALIGTLSPPDEKSSTKYTATNCSISGLILIRRLSKLSFSGLPSFISGNIIEKELV